MRYTVEGGRFAEFPFDMLRYARSWPATPEDASMLGKLCGDRSYLPGRIRVVLETDAAQMTPHCVDRWHSFSWEYLEGEQRVPFDDRDDHPPCEIGVEAPW